MPFWIVRFVALVGAAAVLLAGSWTHAQTPSSPILVALTIDTSGSVGVDQLARGRDLALGLLKNLPPGSEVAVFTFDDASRLVVPRTSRPAEVRQRLAALKMSGRHTALHDALYDASRYLRDAPASGKAIVLITDGRDENSALNLDDGLRVAQDAGIPVHAVAVGRFDARVLRRIAKLTGGTFAPVRDVRATALAAQLSNAPSVAAARPQGQPAPAPQDAGGSPTTPTPPPAGGTPASREPATETRRAAGPASGTALPWIAGALLLAVAGAAVMLVVRQRRQGAACPRCGSELAAPGRPCPHCSVTEAPAPASSSARGGRPVAAASRLRQDDLSPTVVARMNATEEYLEKTVTLRPRPILSVTRGADAGQVVELSETTATSVGRAKANDLIVNDVAVSSQHCRIRPETGVFVLHDLNSTNGTFVNERRVTSQPLAEGDVIKIGETHLQFRLDLKRG
jgi:hypothetical protein